MCIARFVRSMRKAVSNFQKGDAEETRMKEIKRDNGGIPVMHWQVKSDASNQYEKHKYSSQKQKLKNLFHKAMQSFPAFFASSGLPVISCLILINASITGAKHDRS